jgi:phospholipid/cholesterol/gamma-HCH transport system substrate-binding protein
VTRHSGLKVLAFALVCVVLTGYLAFTIGNIRPSHLWFFHQDYSLTANFDDVSGLNVGDDVKVAGVIVGKVNSITVVDPPGGHAADGTGRAQVKFSVHKTVRLAVNTSASIRWRNILGQRYLYLTPPGPSAAAPVVLRSGDRITNTASVVGIGDLFNRLGPIVVALDPSQVNQFIDAVSGALSGNEQNLRQALDNLATITASVASHDEAIGRLVDNVNTVATTVSDRDREIRTVIDNLVAISTTFSANTTVVDDAITNLGTVSANLDRLLGANRDQIDRIIANVNIVLRTLVGKLPQINSALAGFPAASQGLFAIGALGQFLDITIPCLSVELLPGHDAVVPCNTALNSPAPAARTPAAAAGTAGAGGAAAGTGGSAGSPGAATAGGPAPGGDAHPTAPAGGAVKPSGALNLPGLLKALAGR